MTDDINKILASKRAWHTAERRKADRRIKDGTPEQRKDTADVLHEARRLKNMQHHFTPNQIWEYVNNNPDKFKIYDNHQIGTYCTCSACESLEPSEFNFINNLKRLWRRLFPLIILMVISGSAHAYTASWYSQTDAYIKPLTASGEVFNDRGLTAASWAYPLGTRVRVTNVATGRSVVVRITDRGPARRLYRKGRIIDLTRASFARIAPLSDGVIYVNVREL